MPATVTGLGLDAPTAMPYSSAVHEFIETPHFTRILDQYLDDDEYSVLQRYLNSNPEAGAIVPGVRRCTEAPMAR